MAKEGTDFYKTGIGDPRYPFATFLGREDEVGIHRHHGAGSLDAFEGLLDPAASAPGVVAVQGVAQGEVGVGVKAAANQLLALVPFVRGHAAGEEGVGVGFGLGEAVAFEAAVADEGLCTGALEACGAALLLEKWMAVEGLTMVDLLWNSDSLSILFLIC